MAEEKLRKAYGLMKQGHNKEAIAIVQNVLKEDKNSVPAWWLMTNLLADDPERQRKALERVLALDPKHKLALQLQAQQNKGGAAKSNPKPANAPQAQNPNNNMKSTEELNLDWSKIEAREAGKKQVDEATVSKTVQIATYGMVGFIIVVAIALLLMWGIPAYQFSQINNPKDATMRFYNYALQGDFANARTLVCTDVQADFDARVADFTEALNNLKEQLGEGAVLTYDLTGLEANELTNDGTNATVQVSGQYSISAPTISERVITSQITASEGSEDVLRNDNGVWCIAKIQ